MGCTLPACGGQAIPDTLAARQTSVEGARMTILRIVNRKMDREMYEALRKALDIDHHHPLGLIMHGVSEVDGTMQVAQIWESSWYAALFDENLAPMLEAVGAPTEADIRVFELEHLVTP